jgi:multicomponent Na+:H+ antiporter subunit C
METVLAIVVGGLYAAGVYLMLRRSLVKLLFGLALLSHAANLLIFTAAGFHGETPPLVPEGAARSSRRTRTRCRRR